MLSEHVGCARSSSPQYFTVAPPDNSGVQPATHPRPHAPQPVGAFAESDQLQYDYRSSVGVMTQPHFQPEPELEPEPWRQNFGTAMDQRVAPVSAGNGTFGSHLSHFSNSSSAFSLGTDGPIDTHDYYSSGTWEVSMAADRSYPAQQNQQQQIMGRMPRTANDPSHTAETRDVDERTRDPMGGSLPHETRPGPENEWARPRGSQMHQLIDPWAEDDKQKQKQKQTQHGDQQPGGRRRSRGGKGRNKNKNEKLEGATDARVQGQQGQQRQQHGGLAQANKAAEVAVSASAAAQSDGGAVAGDGSQNTNASRGSRGRGSRGKGNGSRNESGNKAPAPQANQIRIGDHHSNPTVQDGSSKPRRQRGGRGRNKAGKAAAGTASDAAAVAFGGGGGDSSANSSLHIGSQVNAAVALGTHGGPSFVSPGLPAASIQAIGPLGSGGRSAAACFPAAGLSLGLTKDLNMGMGRGPDHLSAPESIAQHWANPSPVRTAAPAPVFGDTAFASFSLVM